MMCKARPPFAFQLAEQMLLLVFHEKYFNSGKIHTAASAQVLPQRGGLAQFAEAKTALESNLVVCLCFFFLRQNEN